jgi:LemA protein
MAGAWPWIAAAACALVALVYAAGLYNGLVQVRANVEKAWANIDVLLQQRHAELPNLVEVVKGSAAHEASTLEAVTRLRARYDDASTIRGKTLAENELTVLLGGLVWNAEAYPDLKANQAFLKLQERISALETAIAARREFFNDSVNLHNIRIGQFPQLLLARPFGFAKMEFLAAAAHEKEAVRVGFPPGAKG